MKWEIVYTKAAQKDSLKIAKCHLKEKTQRIIEALRCDPYHNPPPYEKLTGDLSECYSRRINLQHRLVYQVLGELRIVKVLSMWSHYD
ncbi:MAG: toxin of toxin-antitoxin system [Gammaproteobacteria bacterium GWE2_37_16]|nr:MAG: toxin of toxin-antitoxin system [Gammaproteobacteria bacterium GWE2_37_16]